MDKEKMTRVLALCLAASVACAQTPPLVIETVAGFDPDGVKATAVGLTNPWSLATDAAGNVYFSQPNRNRIHRVTPGGVLQIVAGTGELGSSGDDGPALAATLDNPTDLFLDRAGNLYFVTNSGIRRVDAETGTISTVARQGDPEGLRSINGMAAGAPGYAIVADADDHRLKQVDLRNGGVSVIAGTGRAGGAGDGGPATRATLRDPACVAVDRDGNIYFSELMEARVRRIDANDRTISTVSIQPDGEDPPDEYEVPSALTTDSAGNLYVAQANRSRVLRIAAGDGEVTIVAGTGAQEFDGDDQPATAAAVPLPRGLAIDPAGNLLIAGQIDARIRQVDASTGLISTIAGNGLRAYNGDGQPATQTQLFEPANVLPADGAMFIASAFARRVLHVDAAGAVSTVPSGDIMLVDPQALLLDANGDLLISSYDNRMLLRLAGETMSAEGETPVRSSNFSQRLDYQASLASDGSRLYLTDPSHHTIWRLRPGDETKWIFEPLTGSGVSGYSGDGGPAAEAAVDHPTGLAIDPQGNLYFSDTSNHCIRRIDGATSDITTVWPKGDVDPLSRPTGLAFDSNGILHFADAGHHQIFQLDLEAGTAQLIAGTGSPGYSGDGGLAAEAQFSRPCGIAFDAQGNLYIADTGNQRIRRVSAAKPQEGLERKPQLQF
jgi:sugar lactone lactonase YvrE